jgi:hypothetical protein
MPMMLMRPPRNTRQTASYAAGVMVLVAGVFSLYFGNGILYWDTWETNWDFQTDQDVTVVNAGALFAGIAYLAAFVFAVVSAYCAFRLTRYQLAVAGPVALLVAYFSTLAYESLFLIFSVEVLVLSVIALGLIYFAIPIYEGRGTVPTIPPYVGVEEPVDGEPASGLTSDKYP